jgi:xanthine dehydrogenase accessory factor
MYREIFDLLAKDGWAKSAVVLTGENAGARCVWKDGRLCPIDTAEAFDWKPWERALANARETGIMTAGEQKIFVELYSKNPRLILLGGGHVSKPVAQIASLLGFSVTVMDDRPEFITEERFPTADERVLGSFEALSEKIPEYENSYYVVVTRGHAGDTVCARQILNRPYKYFGMIGSKTKVRITREKLLGEGFSPEILDTIHAPIGLPIGGETPEEIAVSIAAEMVQEKNKSRESFADEKVLDAVRSGGHGVMMTIVRKDGSSPRGVGSKLFLDREGKIYGSIGGGNVEYEALKFAEQAENPCLVSYHFSPGDSRNLGMICGGNVDVFFECI